MLVLPALAIASFLTAVRASTFTVTVGIRETDGQQGFGFDPSAILPQTGDTIEFTFQLPSYIKNPISVQHTVTQSTFENPCSPKLGGFDTGIQTTDTTGPSFTLAVNDTQPIWFYSYTNKDCTSGMVLAVNPPTSGQTAAAFQDAAKSATIITPTSSSVLPSGTNTIISATNTATGSHTSASNTGNAVKASFIVGFTLGAAVVAAIML